MSNGEVDWKSAVSLWARRLLFNHGLVVALISLLLALVVGFVWALRAYTVIDLSKQTLSSERVPTAQRYKGIESFILSGLDQVPLNATKIHDDAKGVFKEISQDAQHPVGLDGKQVSACLEMFQKFNAVDAGHTHIGHDTSKVEGRKGVDKFLRGFEQRDLEIGGTEQEVE